MYLFNLTVIIEADHEEPIVLAIRDSLSEDPGTGGEAGRIRLLKMMDSRHEGVTYCLQFQVMEKDAGETIQEDWLIPLQSRLESRFPGKVFFFESIMQYVD